MKLRTVLLHGLDFQISVLSQAVAGVLDFETRLLNDNLQREVAIVTRSVKPEFCMLISKKLTCNIELYQNHPLMDALSQCWA